jgi:hypothetical protein
MRELVGRIGREQVREIVDVIRLEPAKLGFALPDLEPDPR